MNCQNSIKAMKYFLIIGILCISLINKNLRVALKQEEMKLLLKTTSILWLDRSFFIQSKRKI